jgi:hypothetical protein
MVQENTGIRVVGWDLFTFRRMKYTISTSDLFWLWSES